ncbi:unnamed protein product [Schistosoma guineensis]|uniref:Endoplasmic reticulum transmembrane protein n=3 Tax=Schistosoma TaxID=6181 RepID=A0AA85ARF9_9TREM|nr:B-cell receptor-associated protein 29 [Schistosoma haematobium]CAH8288431.1 unnamed protein product [Schistosoma guineensis]CAH8590958.1 unnamed protein product [Schistosoma mattheei]CAH8600391.1 unnamed protein product [Schistosoma intercalatum]KAH9579200.1 B-cell receptor-associated protein 29 [Schistosoma haematobium]CAH8601504.1 unnamed protein product [Schistosoma intercalatum]
MLWHIVVTFLYSEMFVVLLMILPFFSSQTWSKFFKFSIIQKISEKSSFYFRLFLVMLVCVLAEALRNIWVLRQAYNSIKDHPHEMRPETESLYLMRMFRAQRNFYITGFSLFVWFVLHRLVSLLSEHAKMQASEEASIKQAQSATAAAQRLLDQSKVTDSDTEDIYPDTMEALKDELAKLTKKFESEEKAHQKTKQDLETLKKQTLQTNTEYDRVTQECQKLQYRLQMLEGGGSTNKKAD